jgi:hypothetical protein
MKREKVASREELEAALRRRGSSLESERRDFVENTLAAEWLRHNTKSEAEIPLDEILGYYYDHPAEFDRPARARWEELMVRLDKYADRAEAYAAMARMGNQVLSGIPFADVAKRSSDGSTASDRGRHDWTSQGSLVCEELDRALFALPLGALSRIIEGSGGLYIVRVTAREPAGRVPFKEAQVGIRTKLRDQKDKTARETYLGRLLKQTPVVTVFDRPGAPLVDQLLPH